jgi:hypothetical protein
MSRRSNRSTAMPRIAGRHLPLQPSADAYPRGKQKALVATGNSVLTVIYHLLSDPDARFCDLGPGYYESRINCAHSCTGAHSINSSTHSEFRRAFKARWET